MNEEEVTEEEIQKLYEKLNKDAKAGGYCLSPDFEFTKELLKGLIINQKRYGYFACPCRLATGIGEEDIDIICPCDYRDPDLDEFDACYCALYVSQEILDGKKEVESIPERRLSMEEKKNEKSKSIGGNVSKLPLPVWRCKVCGYLCARENPPEICPICKVRRDRFERFI